MSVARPVPGGVSLRGRAARPFRRAASRRSRRNVGFGLLFIAPALALFALFVAYPVIDTIRLSFYDWDGIQPTKTFVGLDNFRELVTQDPYFPRAVWNTLIWTGVTVPVQILVGLTLALVLDRQFRFRVWYRSIFFLPGVMSALIVSFAWGWIYNPEIGVINGFLRALGGSGQAWLAEPDRALWASMALSVWRYSGFTMIFYLAGLQMISPTLYEAARVDGASWWMQLRRITLPLLMPMTALIGLLGLITALREFEVVYLLTRGGPAHATDLLSIQVYSQAFELSRAGYAAAISVFMLGMIAIGSVFALWAMARAHRSVAA
jgi:ABC-type sugar transport system permease subunit